jgi:hypothetical protein
MPTPQEQLTQIESALRLRFFPLVAKIIKPSRAQWTEDQHDTDRLTRALAAYSLVALCGLDDATAAGAVTDGEDDGGIDAIYYDRPRTRLMIIQSKFKRNGAAPSQAENLKTINGIKALMARRFAEFNTHFQQRLDEIEEALDTPGVMIEIGLVYLGENFSPHVASDLDALKGELNVLTPRMTWEKHGLSTVHAWLIAEHTPLTITADVQLENWALITTPRKAIYGQVSAATLAQLVDTHGKALFERNIRHYLGSIGVNTAIADTVRRRPGDFFYLNNGLTAVADNITPAVGGQDRCNFRLTNVSIVNGAQTAGAIATAALAGTISPDAKVLFTIIETGANPDDISLQITRARNYQNVVRGVYFAALDPNQARLRQELQVSGITYHYRPSAEARARRDDAFTLEEAALALACLSFRVHTSQELQQVRTQGRRPANAIDFAVTAKKEIGRLWEQDGYAYPLIFNAELSGVRMCRIVRIYQFVDQILAGSELSERGYNRRMFFRHARYYIMCFVAHRSQDVINKPSHQLSDDDKRLLSQRVNEIAELIYAESTPLQAVKGYLSIFRNLTDSQPLADQILARLAERDRAALPQAPAGAAEPPRNN